MDEARLDNELQRLHKKLPYLWEEYGFRVKYLTRSYGMYHRGFVIGLEIDVCILVFDKETNSQVEPINEYVGKKHSLFAPPNHDYFSKDGWYSLTGLIFWLTDARCESISDVDRDLENLSQYLKLRMDKLLELFKNPKEFDSRLEQLRNQHKDNQITVDKIKAERARLHALGQESSLEAAIANLRGGKK